MQLFIELLYEKMRETKAQTDSSHFKASLKHLRMCGFFFLFEAQFQNLQRKQASPDGAEYQ